MQDLPPVISLLILIPMLVLSTSTLYVRYVKPNDSSSLSCPNQPCLTLDEYTQQTEEFFTSGATFVFLAGNHSLKTAINLVNITDIILEGDENISSINILCMNEVTFLNVRKLTIEGLTFVFHSSNISSAIKVLGTKGLVISKSTFQGSWDINQAFMRALYSRFSTIVIVNCSFEGNTGNNGGAILASHHSNITLSGSIFTGNKAKFSGGAIYATYGSLINLEGGWEIFFHIIQQYKMEEQFTLKDL